MKRHLTVAWVALLTASCATEPQSLLPKSGPLPEVAESDIGYQSPQAALDALRSKLGTRIFVQQGWTIVEDRESASVWSFAPEKHPAYPAVVKRTTYEKDGKVYIGMQVKCGATKDACDALVREFQELNERLKE